MATVPESYNAIKITVSPNALSETSTKVQGLVTDIVNQLETINTQLNKLQLSWVGQSASLANSFNQQWQTATTSLFGTQQDPDEGVLNRLAGGLQSAAANYSTVEQWAQTSFGSLVAGLSGSSGSATSTPQSVQKTSGTIITAITETF